MFTRKIWLPILLIVALTTVGGVVLQRFGVVQAQPPAQRATPSSITIPYPGRLTDTAGQPVPDGAYSFTFALYDAATGGTLLWSEVQPGVKVQGGAFLTALGQTNPIPTTLLEGGERWLEVTVNGSGQDAPITLAPRQQVSVPQAAGIDQASACAHTHWGESWTGTGIGLYLANEGGGQQVWLNSILTSIMATGDWSAGVYGQSTNNIGVYGVSSNSYGVEGEGTGAGNYGGYFTSAGDHFDLGLGGSVGRINAADDAESRLYLSSNQDIVLKIDNDGGSDNAMRIQNSGGTDVCTVNEAGDLNCLGWKGAVVKTAQYGWRSLAAIESPEVWFEDVGSATLANGEITVAFEAILAETANLQEEYHVFVTPLSEEPVLLFVTQKTANGFTVRGVTLDGRPAACSFDYRVVARRLGYENVRLPEIPWQEEEAQP